MKKFVAAFLCLIILLSLFSCANDNIKDNGNNDTNDINNDTPKNETTNITSANYDSVLEIYRLIVEKFPIVNQNPRAVAAELGIQDEAEIEAFVNLYSSIHLFYPGIGQEDSESPHHKLGCGYSVKDLNGDGADELVLMNKDYYIMAIFSCYDGKPVLLGNYRERNSCWIDDNGLIHNNGSSGADYSTNAVYRIADDGESLELVAEFGTNGHEWIGDVAYTKYYKVVGGEKVSIAESEFTALAEQYGKYLGSVAGAEATKQYSGLTFTLLYTEAEIAMEMYEAAINDEICVIDEHLGEIKLKACRFPSNNARIDEGKLLAKAILDLDGDGINEYVIQSPDKDHIVLHYYGGKVFSYCFDKNNFYNLNADGSFYWSDSYESENWTHGLNQITFDGSSLSIKEIYRIKHITPFDFYEDLEFYVDGKHIKREEFLDYHKSEILVIFSPLDISCEYPISSEKACEIASNYWGIESGMSEGATGTRILHKIVILEKPNSDTQGYRISWQWEGYRNHVPDPPYSLPPENVIIHKELFVDAITGECREYTDSERAMQMYEAALKNEIKIYETDIEEYNYLKDCKTPYNRIPLCELERLRYVYMDVDGDSVNELVVDCGDTLILRYYEGTVYVYPFTFRAMYQLNTDGSYNWNHTGQDFEYGEDQLVFDGAELKPKEIWRIVNDGAPNAEYYIGDKQVTQEEILKYIEDNPKTKVEFLPLEVSWLNKISRSEAITIAENYWKTFDIEENGYRVERAVNSWAPDSVYVLVIRKYVIDHYSTFDEIWVDKTTGKTIIPYAPDGKG